MNIHELDSYNLGDAVKFHRRLNPRIWGRDEHLLPEVRERLLTIAEDFQEFLGVEDLDVQDITISGSNAAYSYTKNSDIDLHLVVAMPDNPVYQELFNAKKYQYNDEHNIKIGGADVELYVQPADQAHHSQGIYSIKDNKWLSIPQRKRAQVDDVCVRDKTADLDARIHAAVKSKNIEAMSTLWDKIKSMRKSGLEQHGEFGCENIAFKMLRNSGCIGLLKDAITAAQDRELSLREAPRKRFRYGYGAEVDEASLADMRSAFARDANFKPTKSEVFHGPDEYEKVRKQREAERQAKIAKIARTPVKPWPMGMKEGMQSQPYSTSDGVAASTKEFLEDAGSDNNLVHEFIQHVAVELGIDPLPEIQLHTDPEWSTHNHSFGRYDPDSHTLNVSMPNRHILDVLRTVAHELVHCSQSQQHGELPADAGETGSRWENDANARAGIIMRDWANSHPEHFELPPLGESASGYIPKNKREAAMPQYAMALSVDIHPGQTGKEANKLGLKTGRNGEPGLLMPDAQNLLREFAEFTEEQDNLFEITMSPTSLKKLSAQTGALAGMEFEMIVPSAGGDDDGDLEPDYDFDQRCRSIQDARDFFYDGDYNGRRDVENMSDRMQNDFSEWLYERLDRDFVNESEYLISEWVANNVDESEWNPDDLEGESRQEALDEFIANVDADPSNDYYQKALDEYREENQDSYDESDWLDAEDLDLMSGVENAYSISWPHWRSTGGGEVSINDVANSFQTAVGRDVKASSSYHSGRVERPSTRSLHYIVEPDASLDPDDSDDQGLEFVSPPLPIEELLSDLNKVKAWADKTGCYTNDSTGLHINVSVPGWTGGTDQLDYVKLALLLGDEFVLSSFGRTGNTYAKSAMGKIRDAVRKNPDRAQELMDRMKSGMDQLASKVVHSRSTDKYTSINVKDGYIEFRSPGGDWLNDKFPEIENTLRRFTVALSAAVDPAAYREEYLKKLYKLLDVSGEKDPLSYFAKYAAGELPRAALKSFVRQAQLERGVKRGKETGPMVWKVSNPPQSLASIEVVANSKEEAIKRATAQDGYPAWANTINSVVAEPLRPYKQEPQGVDTRVDYELYSRASGAVIDTFPARNDDEAQIRLNDYREHGAGQSNPDNFGVRRAGRGPTQSPTDQTAPHPEGRGRPHDPTGRYGIVARSDQAAYGRTGGPAPNYQFRFNMQNLEDQGHGRYVLQAWAARNSVDPADYMVVDTTQYADANQIPTIDIDLEPAPVPQPAGMGQWNGQWKVLVGGREVYRFGGVGNSQADANRIAAAWLRSSGQGVSGEGFEVYPVMAESLREYKMPQPSQGPGRYKDLNEPLGPETPPKMPSGTVKVDVSDMYDWYKLGQKISDLDSIQPGELGQGPPSTVFAFGSEDLENMYSHELMRLGLKTHDLDEPGEEDIDEGWIKNAAMAAAAAGAMAFTPAPANSMTAPSAGPGVQPAAAVKQAPQQAAGPEAALTRAAKAAGLKGVELAQFLAQCAHETGDFAHLEELGGNRYLAKYDPKVNPAKAKALGNTQAGDGAKYKGRGFIQITGKANYANAGQALGIDLVNKPELAAKPDVAAKIAVWYWQNRVSPYVQDFSDTRGVTKRINPGLAGLQDRVENFKDYQQQVAGAAAPVKVAAAPTAQVRPAA
jgi:putative chitinase